jgi:tRNA threonylcarbamoyl adenosine modification protein (Sua5/YciO/YrdC/YwlC family)
MQTVKLSDVVNKKETRKKIIAGMRRGDVFVYPTDTIYGIGCNAEIPSSVEKIKKAKGREAEKQFSVIAPGKEWIWENANMTKANKEFADQMLPGPYTIIVKATRNAPRAVVSGERSLGVRLPNHPLTGVIKEAGIPFVSTSVNLTGEEPVCSIKDIPDEIHGIVDWAIDTGKISGLPSRVFDLRTDKVKILRY